MGRDQRRQTGVNGPAPERMSTLPTNPNKPEAGPAPAKPPIIASVPVWLYLALMLLGYALLTQVVKTWFIRRFGE